MPKKKTKKAPSEAVFFNAFPTQILRIDWDFRGIQEFNERLARSLYRMRSDDPVGIKRSNMQGTWHSRDTVLSANGELGDTLKTMFSKGFRQMIERYAIKGCPEDKYQFELAAWAMMYRHGGYAAPHTHPNCHLSGVYYVDAGATTEAGGPETSRTWNEIVAPGTLEFLDTRYGVGQQQLVGHVLAPAFRLAPRAGRMAIFPSGLPHFVHPVEHDPGCERISIACNATVRKYMPHKE